MAIGVVVLVLACGPVRTADAAEAGGPYERVVVAADHPLASAAGAEIAERGGNVVDAAVATSFALSVVRPYSCGLGGGGFMVVWDADERRALALDYRERAPRAATRDVYERLPGSDEDRREASRHGGLAAAIPGTVAGLCEVQRRFGELRFADVLQPAIRLAREGWPADQNHVEIVSALQRRFAKSKELRERFAALHELYLNDGKPISVGDGVMSPQADVLAMIAERGPAAFDTGDVAESLLKTVRDAGGIWTAEDLADVKPVMREPLRGETPWGELVLMPPPSSGGVAILETLRVLSAYEDRHEGFRFQRNEPPSVHVLAEAFKHAFADRARHLGDADFAEVPVAKLTGREYAAELAGRIRSHDTLPLREYGTHAVQTDGGTSHFSVMDAAGNAVACTETINTGFGSWVVDPKYGIVLNNEMDDFSARPGEPNAFGLVQSEANAVEPGKKPLSSMSPTILVEEGRAVLAVGASGGPRIITATLQVLLDVGRGGNPVHDAVRAPRFHHQWQPNELQLETPLFERLREPLADRGHDVGRTSSVGVVQAASRTERGLFGSSDPRKGGRPAGR